MQSINALKYIYTKERGRAWRNSRASRCVSGCSLSTTMELSFTLWTLSTTHETWPTHRERVGSVETPVIFLSSVTKVHRIEWACAGEIAVCNAVLCSTISCLFCSTDIRNEVVMLSKTWPKILMFWAAKVLGGVTYIFLTQFYKFGWPPNMCQNLVLIDRVTSEIKPNRLHTADANETQLCRVESRRRTCIGH